MRQSLTENIRAILALIATIAIIIAVYRPGLSGPFVFDDYHHIVDNPAIAIQSLSNENLHKAVFPAGTGISQRPLATLSFALNYYFSGESIKPGWFKLTNLAIHLINTFLVFCLVRLLLRQHQLTTAGNSPSANLALWLSILVATIWGLHPLNVNAVLYVVQRMTSLATLFMLAGLISFVIGRQTLAHSRRRGLSLMIIGAVGGTLLGMLTKEIALLLPLYLLVIDYCFFRSRERVWPIVARNFHATSIGILVLATACYAYTHDIFAVYDQRDFTMGQRLLTEARVLWFYLSLLVLPVPGRFSLFHDDIVISAGLFSPWTTLVAILGLAAGVMLAIKAVRRLPVLSFAILWFLAGHVMESTVIGLEIAQEHRNYLPSLGPLLAISYYVALGIRHYVKTIVSITSAALIVSVLAFGTFMRASAWGSEESLIKNMAVHHPESPRALSMLAELHATRYNDPLRAVLYYQQAMLLSPADAGPRLRLSMTIPHPALKDQMRQVFETSQNNPEMVAVRLSLDGVMSFNQQPELKSTFINNLAIILRIHPVSPDTRQALLRLGRCITETPHSCRSLSEPALQWYAAISDNPAVDPALRRYAILMLFEITVAQQKYELALQAAETGRKQEPNDANYDLMTANALILLKRFPEAGSILETIRARTDLDSETKANLEQLHVMLVSRQRQKEVKPKQ